MLGGRRSATDAVYRFVRHEPGMDVVLFGAGRFQRWPAPKT